MQNREPSNHFLALECFLFSLPLLLYPSPSDLTAWELCSDPVLRACLSDGNVLFVHKHNKGTDKNVSAQGQGFMTGNTILSGELRGGNSHLILGGGGGGVSGEFLNNKK